MSPATEPVQASPIQSNLYFAGFWKRVLASLLDSLITMVAIWIVVLLLAAVTGVAGASIFSKREDLTGGLAGVFVFLYFVVILVGPWLYYALMESREGATLGKRALNLKVTDLQGRKVSFGQATGRYFGKILSSMILLIGYLMVAFTEKKQGLHDILAGTLVLEQRSGISAAVPMDVAENAAQR